jgi:type VI secretion system secreted protein VgrG
MPDLRRATARAAAPAIAAPNPQTSPSVENPREVAATGADVEAATPVLQAADQQLGQAVAPEIQSGLGEQVDALVARSPLLRTWLEQLQADGWTVERGPANGGSYADRSAKRVVMAEGLTDPAVLTQVLAHEVGHARYTPGAYVDFGDLSREDYVQANTHNHMVDEAEATIANLQVRDELNQGEGAVDIGVAGAGAAGYIAAWERFKAGEITREELVDAIASNFASGERPSTDPTIDYGTYFGRHYEQHWDAHHPSRAAP